MTNINDNWLFTEDYSKGFDKAEGVRIPHNPSKLPLHYSSPDNYEMVSGYKKTIVLEEEDLDKRIFLRFDGVAHIATLYFNGKEIGGLERRKAMLVAGQAIRIRPIGM